LPGAKQFSNLKARGPVLKPAKGDRGIKWLVKSKPILKKGMGFLFFGALRFTVRRVRLDEISEKEKN